MLKSILLILFGIAIGIGGTLIYLWRDIFLREDLDIDEIAEILGNIKGGDNGSKNN